MLEREWLLGDEPRPLWKVLAQQKSSRKWGLFASACCRRMWQLLKRPWPDQEVVEAAERHAEEVPSKRRLLDAAEPIRFEKTIYFGISSEYGADLNVSNKRETINVAASLVALAVAQNDQEELAWQAGLVRCIFGNPFCSLQIESSWLVPSVLALAAAAYDQRDLPGGTLDPVRLAILSDALEDTGCTDLALLGHLRNPGPHVRGCHVLDALLGRN